MSIELILEEATQEETEGAIRGSPFEILARQKHKLFFGASIGTARNQFWRNPSTGRFVVDYVQFDDIVADETVDYTEDSFDKFLSNEESDLIK